MEFLRMRVLHWLYQLHVDYKYVHHTVTYYKVNRCLARYSLRATTTSQPTSRAPQNEQKCQFRNPPGHQKNDPEWQQTRSGPELRRNGRFYVWLKSGFLPKNGFWPKKITQNDILGDVYLGKGNFFLWTTFSGCGQNMVSIKKRVFLWAHLGFWPKNPIFAIWPQFCSMTLL